MKKALSFLIILVIAASLAGLPVVSAHERSEAGVLIVKIKNQYYQDQLAPYGENLEFLFDNVYRLKVKDKTHVLHELSRADSWVEFVEEEAAVKTEVTVSDPLFVLDSQELTKQWYLPKMQVQQAWDLSKGKAVIIAIVDTGINGRHEDLGDGRVIKGYANYCQVLSSITPNECLVKTSGEIAPGANSDDNGHGTIVAGIIGAITNNGKGIAGINWNTRLMPIKALDAKGSGLASDVAGGIHWAVDNGAKVINLSIGGPGLMGIEVLQDAISYAFNKGVLIVAAAGNDAAVTGGNLNTNPVLPVCADGGQNMVIGVAAIDIYDRKARFSNYGSNCIDISAPGTGTFVDKQNKQGLVSTYYDPTKPAENSLYVYAVGTSVAAPMVSGVAGLMVSAFPDLDVQAIRDRLISSVDNIDGANGTGCNDSSCIGQIGKGRLNALKAVQMVTTFASGTLIKGQDGQVWLIERGLKRPVSEFVFNQHFVGAVTTAATDAQLESFPTGLPVPPSDGTLIKEPNSPTVYLVEGGERRALSFLAFVSRGFRFENVMTLPPSEVISYKQGDDAPVLDDVLVKALDHPAVFILNQGTKRLLSFFVFIQRGFQNQGIVDFFPEELARHQTHAYLYPPLEGTLIRGNLNPTVFLVQDGKLRALNLAAFENRGLRFEDVKVVPQSEIQAYEIGEPIIE